MIQAAVHHRNWMLGATMLLKTAKSDALLCCCKLKHTLMWHVMHKGA